MTGASIALLLDVSGSMGDDKKLKTAQSAASAFINIMHTGDRVGVIKFSDDPTIIFPTNATSSLVDIVALPTPPIPAADKVQYNAGQAIIATSSGGWTGTKAAISKGFGMFPATLPSNPAMVLLSDGLWNWPKPLANSNPVPVSETTVPIYTIGFDITTGGTAATSLTKIATGTSGAYHHAPNSMDLLDVYMAISGTTTTNLIKSKKQTMPSFKPLFIDVQVSSTTGPAKFAVTWDDQSILYTPNAIPVGKEISSTLYDPNNNVVTPDQVGTGKGFAVYTVNTPVIGKYQLSPWTGHTGKLGTVSAGLEGGGTTTSLSLEPANHKAGDKVPFVLKLEHDGKPVTDVNIRAVVNEPLLSTNETIDSSDESQVISVSIPRREYPTDTIEKNPGEYHGVIDTKIQGSYTVLIDIEGKSPVDGSSFTRYTRASLHAA